MNEKTIFTALKMAGASTNGACAMMGNMYAESGLDSKIAERYYMDQMGITSETYVTMVDDRSYANFINDCVGFGLCQWTYKTRKKALLEYAEKTNKSIGDLGMQLEYLIQELKKSFPGVWSAMCSYGTVKDISDIIMVQFENPADQSDNAKRRRADYGLNYLRMVSDGSINSEQKSDILRRGSTGDDVKFLQRQLIDAGYLSSGEDDGVFGNKTFGALLGYQYDKGLDVDGVCGEQTWSRIK